MICELAGVEELADSQGLGPCARKSVQVQVLSPVLDKIQIN